MPLGDPFKTPQPVTVGLSGFGGASVCLPPIMGWKKTMTPGDVRTCFTVSYEVWEVPPEAIKNQSVARSISSSSPN